MKKRPRARVAFIRRMPRPIAQAKASWPNTIGSQAPATVSMTAGLDWTTKATPAVRSRPANIHRNAWLRKPVARAADGRTSTCAWDGDWKLIEILLDRRWSAGADSDAARGGRGSPASILPIRRLLPRP